MGNILLRFEQNRLQLPDNVGNCVTKVGGYTLHGSTNPNFSQVHKKTKGLDGKKLSHPQISRRCLLVLVRSSFTKLNCRIS